MLDWNTGLNFDPPVHSLYNITVCTLMSQQHGEMLTQKFKSVQEHRMFPCNMFRGLVQSPCGKINVDVGGGGGGGGKGVLVHHCKKRLI